MRGNYVSGERQGSIPWHRLTNNRQMKTKKKVNIFKEAFNALDKCDRALKRNDREIAGYSKEEKEYAKALQEWCDIFASDYSHLSK